MAQPTEDKLLKVLRDALAGVSDPALAVTDAVQAAWELPAGSVQVVPLRLRRIGAGGGGKQEWRLAVLVLVTMRLGAATAAATAWSGVLAAARAALAATAPEALAAAVRTAGGLTVLRGDPAYWVKPPGGPGAPAGAYYEIEFSFYA